MTAIKNENGIEKHCPTCHEEEGDGLMPYGEWWDWEGCEGEDLPPEDKRYCCCEQKLLARFINTYKPPEGL